MAGSYHHLIDDDGKFTMDLIDHLGDAHEACEECVWLIEYLAGGDKAKIEEAIKVGQSRGWTFPAT